MVMMLTIVAAYAYALFLQAPRPSRRGAGGWLRWVTTVEASRFMLVSTDGLAMSLSVVLTGSRSGLASLIVALAFLALAVWRSTPGGRSRVAALGFLGVLVVGGLAWGGADILLERFARAPAELEGRFAAWRDTRAIIGDFPWFGTGLGTYGQAMLVYQTGDRTSMYVQAHNDYLQVMAEGGLLVGIPVLVVFGLIASGIRRRLSSGQDDRLTAWIRLGAIAGLLGVAAQSFVEFSLQMPGNAVLFVVLMAIALHRPGRIPHAARV
jgi:O-antigen ligase